MNNIEQLAQVLQAFLNAQTAEEQIAILQQRPELMEPETIEQIRALAMMQEEDELARILTELADHFEQLGQAVRNAVPGIASSPSPLGGNPIEWARLARQYIALHRDEDLQWAIDEAQKTGDTEIVDLLQTLQSGNLQAVLENAMPLHQRLLSEDRQEESWTIALLLLHIRASLVERYMNFPVEQQWEALQAGIEASEQAAAISKGLGDMPCLALFKGVLGTGFYQARRLESAVAAYEEARDTYRALAEKQPEVYLSDVAMTLNNLGNALSDLRRLESAVAAYEEARDTYRALAEKQPEVYLSDVAMTLNNLGNALSDLRRLESAVAAYEEALKIHRALADKQPEVYTDRVASTLNNLGNALRNLRRLESAVAAYEEARDMYRALADKQPEVYLADVAMTLNNLGNALSDLRRLESAVAAYEEARDTYRALAEKQPEVYTDKVAATLNNLGAALRNLRRLESAVAAYEEALKIHRALADKQPEVYTDRVASTLNNLGNALFDLRRLESAVEAYEEARDTYRALADKQPEVYTDKVATTLNNLGAALSDLRRLESAVAAYEEARDTYRALAEKQPEVYTDKVAATLNNLGAALRNLRRLESAVAAYEEALKIHRALADKQPEVYLADVAMTLNNLGAALSDLRRLESAVAAYEEARDTYRALADKQPEVYLADVAMTLNNLGAALSDLRRLESAVAAYEEARDTYRALADKQPEVYLADVAMTLNNLGNALRNLRRLESAVAAYEEARDMYRALADKQPEVYLADVAMTLNNLGNALSDLRRLESAVAACEEARDTYRALAEKQPEVYTDKVAATLNNLGAALFDLRRLEAAVAAYEEARDMYRALADKQPEVYLADVAMTLNNLGAALFDLRRLEAAVAAYEEARDMYRALADKQPEVYLADVAMTLNNLGAALSDLRRLESAVAACEEARDTYRALAEKQPEVYTDKVAATLNNLGAALFDLRRLEAAVAAYEEARDMYRALADKQPEVYTDKVAATLNNLGNALFDLRRLESAGEVYDEAITLYRTLTIPDQFAKTLNNRARLFMEQSVWEEAKDLLQEAKGLAEQLRSEGMSLDRRMQIMRENLSIYENLLLCLMKLNHFEEALEVAEAGKSRTLIDLLKQKELRPKNVSDEVWDEYTRMLFQARALEDDLRDPARLSEQTDPNLPEGERGAQLEQIVQQKRAALSEANGLINRQIADFKRADPDYLPHAETISLEEMKQLAAKADSTLALFRVTSEGSYVFLVFPDGSVETVSVPAFTETSLMNLLAQFEGEGDQRKAVDGWMARYYAYRRASDAEREEARERWHEFIDETLGTLYQNLLKPVHEQLKGKTDSLVIVPNRGLAVLPLHACWWEENGKRCYLLDEFTIRAVPSLTLFQMLHNREREKPGRLVGIVNPTQDLMFTEWECEEIERILGDANCLMLRGDEAEEAKVMRHASQAHYLHGSCHGIYRLDAPMESALFLANGESLTLGEVLERMSLPQASLVALSACETGLSDFRRADDEQYGLPLGFLYAGAPSVWGTLWMVNDFSTALLMKTAYEKLILEGKSKADALREAQLWLRDATKEEILALMNAKEIDLGRDKMAWTDIAPRRWTIEDLRGDGQCPFAHPYYWAGFQHVGV